jgi:hypothetical protein
MIDNLINQIFGQTDDREKLQAFAARILLEQQKLNSPCLTNKWGKEHAETSYVSPEYNPIKFPIMTHQIKGINEEKIDSILEINFKSLPSS